MSEGSLPHWRTSTRSFHRQKQEPSAAASKTSVSKTAASPSLSSASCTALSFSLARAFVQELHMPFSSKNVGSNPPPSTSKNVGSNPSPSTSSKNVGSNPPPSTSVAPAATTTAAVTTAATVTTATSQLRDSNNAGSATGRKRKANFSNEETETLVQHVVKHFSALYGSEALRTESTRRNQRRSQLWNQIQKHVNELGYTPRSIDDLKHKWRDLRLDVKRKISSKRSTSSSTSGSLTPSDPRLTPMEELVASTIGHHSGLDGEQDGIYLDPGTPRQSIFLQCRAPPGMCELSRGERLNSAVLCRPEPRVTEVPVISPTVVGGPQISYVGMSEEEQKEEPPDGDIVMTDVDIDIKPCPDSDIDIKPCPDSDIDIKIKTCLDSDIDIKTCSDTDIDIKPCPDTDIDIKPCPATWPPVEEDTNPSLLPGAQDVPCRCDSQGSMISSPEDSLGHLSAQPDWGQESSAENPNLGLLHGPTESMRLKEEEEEEEENEGGGSSQGMEMGSLPGGVLAPPTWQERQEDWEQQSGSPQRSENAREDSLPSSASQEGDHVLTATAAMPERADCSCLREERRTMWRTNMHRLLELEEQWDQLYHQELAMWEEERIQQREQRVQDRELQLQLLSVLTDIRDELQQLREQRAASRENHADTISSGEAPGTPQGSPAAVERSAVPSPSSLDQEQPAVPSPSALDQEQPAVPGPSSPVQEQLGTPGHNSPRQPTPQVASEDSLVWSGGRSRNKGRSRGRPRIH